MEQKQDEVLEDMEQALNRLTEMSKDIGKELKSSQEYVCCVLSAVLSRFRSLRSIICSFFLCRELEKMDQDLDENLAHMNIVMKKLGKLLQTSGSLCCSTSLFLSCSLCLTRFVVLCADTGKICCIIALFAIALVLFFILVGG